MEQSLQITDTDWLSRLSEMTAPLPVVNDERLLSTLQKIVGGERISTDRGKMLFENCTLTGLASLANMIKSARFGDYIFFNENLHINSTNICSLACRFCAFRKGPRSPDSYELSATDFISRIAPFNDHIDEVHIVGGLHPKWTLENYTEIYQAIKNEFPTVSIKSLTAIEVKHLSSRSGLSIDETLSSLKDSGLNSLPGGGAEILVDSIRNRICHGKETSDEYLSIHGKAHSLGIPTNCTMLFGTIESIGDRMEHLDRLRLQQDISGGFQCFVPYPFLPDNSRLPEANIASANEVIRMISISRIMLDNISHIKAYRMNIGDKIASIAINSGADDIDGTVGHEEIMHVAGSTTRLDYDKNELSRLVFSSGSTPVRRNSTYSIFEVMERLSLVQRLILPVAN